MEKKSHSDLVLAPTMPNIELSELFSYTTLYLNFTFQDQFLFELWKHTHMETHTHPDAHKDSDKFSIVAFCKRAALINHESFAEAHATHVVSNRHN